jgi:hypothetical protein
MVVIVTEILDTVHQPILKTHGVSEAEDEGSSSLWNTVGL